MTPGGGQVNVHACYLKDLGALLRDDIGDLRKQFQSASSDQKEFLSGQLMAYSRVVSLMQQQAIAFDLSLADIALDGIDPDNDVLVLG